MTLKGLNDIKGFKSKFQDAKFEKDLINARLFIQ